MAISTSNEVDPWAEFTTPPAGESPAERALRERKEAEAQRTSQRIDDELKQDKARMKKEAKAIVKVLLLGQSESGKSTTLKNFRMTYAADEWSRERNAWRAVIQLNLIRSIVTIVEVLQEEMDGDEVVDPLEASEPVASSSTSQATFLTDTLQRPSTASSTANSVLSVHLTDQHQLLKLRLGPLRRVETDLRRRLGAATDEITASYSGNQSSAHTSLRNAPELQLASHRWRNVIEPSEGAAGMELLTNEATEVISACCEDMKALWADETVRLVLRKRKVNLEDEAGFFLNDLDRIATPDYEPSDDDVVRARLRTLGIQEYRIKFEKGLPLSPDLGREWIIYDVGGSRTVRRAWLPYFEGVNAIIFLAPISCFNESLLEDPGVNRLEDSFLIWRAIVSSKLLAKTTMIVFLNKCDLLKKKIKAGVRIKKYLPSFGDRENELNTVVKFLRDRFKDVSKAHSPQQPRPVYIYATSVIDTKATAVTLKTVRDGILREHLKEADLV